MTQKKEEKMKLIQFQASAELFERLKLVAKAESTSIKGFMESKIEEILADYPPTENLEMIMKIPFHKRYTPEQLEKMIKEAVPSPPSSERGKIPMRRGKRGK